MIESMYLDGTKAKNVARLNKVSNAFMSYLRKEVDVVGCISISYISSTPNH